MRSPDRDIWVKDATDADILDVARRLHANLKRAGREYVGPCPACGGRDRFSINPVKRIFNCRGAGGGGVVSMVMHILGCDFLEACEEINGCPAPGSQDLTEAERQERAQRLAKRDADRAERDRQDEETDRKDREQRVDSASAIWRYSNPIARSEAADYLRGRGVDDQYFVGPELRCHPSLWHSDAKRCFQALVARVADAENVGIGVWRIWVGNGKKGRAPVSNAKMGLGDFRGKGGAVRLGGVAEEIGIAEGIETACAVRELNYGAMPVWSCLTAGGIETFIVPVGIKRVVIFEDADLWKLRPNGTYEPPRGRRAAQVLVDRYAGSDVQVSIETPSVFGKGDYVDILRKIKGLPDE